MSARLPPGLTVVRAQRPTARDGGYREPPEGAAIVIQRTWRSIWGLWRGVFFVVWGLGFGCAGLSALVGRTGWHPAPPPIPIAVAFASLGAGALYVGLCLVLNRTTIRVTRPLLTIEDGPLPWRRRVSVALQRPVAVASSARRQNDLRNGGGGPLMPVTHEISVVHRDATSTVLVSQIRDAADAEATAAAIRDAIDAST